MTLERRAGHLARQLLRAATRPLAKRSPIERCPGWLGTLHNLNVPKNVLPNVREEARGGAAVDVDVERDGFGEAGFEGAAKGGFDLFGVLIRD